MSRRRPARPTTIGPPLMQSNPIITTATRSSFQIRRGRKPTLITVATRGESSSPVINKFNSIPLRSWPISDLNRVIFQSIFLWIIPLISIQEWVITAAAQSVFFSELIRPSNLPKLAVYVSIIRKAWISRSRPFIISAITARAAHVPPPMLHAATSSPSPPLPSPARCPRPLPPHRHHPPAARAIQQRPRSSGSKAR
ncbi:hypothetical protein ACLOJK_006571, partial [Asimina triloba]